MSNALRQFALLRPALSPASGVALLLAFVLLTHAFWCVIAGPVCESNVAHAVPTHAIASDSVVTHTHVDADVCAGMDEAKNRAIAAISPFIAPILCWVALVFLAAAQLPLLISQRAAVFGRDGPICVPPLHSRLVRASLPHRAPPVFLI